MSLAPRAAAIRGDDYQHAVGWYWACQALDDPDTRSVSIEDAAGGHFDDVVVRRRQGPDLFWQVKSSNYGAVTVNEAWLLTPLTTRGRSPLQHFLDTWRALRPGGKPFELTLLTNRGFDSNDPLLTLRDLKTEKSTSAGSPPQAHSRGPPRAGALGRSPRHGHH
jgi:hypothetical protein